MSKLLINEYPLLILPSLATKIGLNEAIVIQQLHYWLNQPGVGVYQDGLKWIHNTYSEWQTNFPFWSVDTVKRTLHSLEIMGLVISAQFAPNPFDKTKSYRVNYEQLASLDEGNLHPSITETTVSDTNNTPSAENQPLAPLPLLLSIENQIYAGVEKVSAVDNAEMAYMNVANLLAMGKGIDYHVAYGIAYAFMSTRGIVIPEGKIKGNRKALKEMMDMGVLPNHAQEATQQLMDAKMTVTDLFSISKTAIALANPAPETYKGALDGV